jgi:WD40 repeat protein
MYNTTNMTEWEEKWTHKDEDGAYIDAAFSRDSKWLFVARLGATALLVLNTDTGKPPKRQVLDSTIHFCPDLADIAGWSCSLATSATLLIGAGGSETPDATLLKVWRIDKLDGLTPYELIYPKTLIVGDSTGGHVIALSPDGQLLAVGALKDGEVRVYTIDDENQQKEPSEWSSVCFGEGSDMQCHNCVQVRFSNRGWTSDKQERTSTLKERKLLAASWGNFTFSVFDVMSAARVAHFGGTGRLGLFLGTVLAFSPDDRELATGGLTEPVVLHQFAPIQPGHRYTIAASGTESGTCTVHVLSARKLAPSDRNGKADPYVKLCLKGGQRDEARFQTDVQKETLSPEWSDKPFRFSDVRPDAVLIVEVFDWDRASKDDPMGQVSIPVSEMPEPQSTGKPHWFKLEPMAGVQTAQGEIELYCTFKEDAPLSFAAMSRDYVALVRGSLVVVQSRATGEVKFQIEADDPVMSVQGGFQPVAVSNTHVADWQRYHSGVHDIM